MAKVSPGLEQFLQAPPAWINGRRLGLLANPASVDASYRHAKDLIEQRLPGCLKAIFSPQHGFYAEKQDNMIESADSRDPDTGLPIFSLYGHTRQPTRAMLEGIDVLLIDLQDVGTRVYTFATTVSYCLEKAKETGIPVLVLDRPNPVGGLQVEGNRLEPEFASFVGRCPVPMRHGLTLGELALYMNAQLDIQCRLSVIAMKGWQRRMYFPDTGLPWLPPSPNLPTPHSAMVYPGQVIFEGSNISEGRGTTTPFEVFGAPFIDPARLLDFMGGPRLPGAVLRPVAFEPMFHKWAQETCRGLHIHLTRPELYNAYETSLKLLQAILYHYPGTFQWRQPPYEYEWEKLPIDLITGSDRIRRQLEQMAPIEAMAASWQTDVTTFKEEKAVFHLYD